MAPLFRAVNIKCESVPVDTDLFGTFSGEIERTGTVRETLRKKKVSLWRFAEYFGYSSDSKEIYLDMEMWNEN
ncbi:MAG: hypothetical protein N2578_01855 [Bdellovibrionaceae bacterium]|nr:hypothetical protein [Pseudobdellovibrionaceae bacterium]